MGPHAYELCSHIASNQKLPMEFAANFFFYHALVWKSQIPTFGKSGGFSAAYCQHP
jgi:hypothetical protein